jgi:hypothetical protein
VRACEGGRERKAEREEQERGKDIRRDSERTYILISFLLIFVICFEFQVQYQFSCVSMDRLHYTLLGTCPDLHTSL